MLAHRQESPQTAGGCKRRLGFAPGRENTAAGTDSLNRPPYGCFNPHLICWIIGPRQGSRCEAGRIFTIHPPISVPSPIFFFFGPKEWEALFSSLGEVL